MEKKVLTISQQKVLDFLGSKKEFQHFYLSGGTALAAFYLQHRISDDLDFFTENKISSTLIQSSINEIKLLFKGEKIKYEKLYDRNIFFIQKGNSDLKLEFTIYPFRQMEKGKKIKGLRIDSFRDIAANKLMALLDRFDPKDFVDLYFILQKVNLNKLQKDTEKKFGVTIDPIFLGTELAKVKRVAALPKMLKPLTVSQLKTFFSDLVLLLKPKIF